MYVLKLDRPPNTGILCQFQGTNIAAGRYLGAASNGKLRGHFSLLVMMFVDQSFFLFASRKFLCLYFSGKTTKSATSGYILELTGIRPPVALNDVIRLLKGALCVLPLWRNLFPIISLTLFEFNLHTV